MTKIEIEQRIETLERQIAALQREKDYLSNRANRIMLDLLFQKMNQLKQLLKDFQ